MAAQPAKATKVVKLLTSIPVDLNDALDAIVTVTGVSKASTVSAALALYVSQLGFLPPSGTEIVPTRTSGRGLAAKRKKVTQ